MLEYHARLSHLEQKIGFLLLIVLTARPPTHLQYLVAQELHEDGQTVTEMGPGGLAWVFIRVVLFLLERFHLIMPDFQLDREECHS